MKSPSGEVISGVQMQYLSHPDLKRDVRLRLNTNAFHRDVVFPQEETFVAVSESTFIGQRRQSLDFVGLDIRVRWKYLVIRIYVREMENRLRRRGIEL